METASHLPFDSFGPSFVLQGKKVIQLLFLPDIAVLRIVESTLRIVLVDLFPQGLFLFCINSSFTLWDLAQNKVVISWFWK